MVIFLTTCTTSKKFELLKTDSFSLGKTTYDEILQRFGKPYHEGSVAKNESTLKTVSYLKMNDFSDDQPVSAWVSPIRVNSFYFTDNILVGHEFTSSYLFGNRYGRCIYPLVKNKDEMGIIYVYTQTEIKGFTSRFYSQSLILSVNKQGVVTDFEFASSGQM
jgi:hypothetical protein